MHKKQVVDPESDRLSKPFAKLTMDGMKITFRFSRSLLTCSGLEGTLVCSTGFKDSDLLHVSKVVKLMGTPYHTTIVEHADFHQAELMTNS